MLRPWAWMGSVKREDIRKRQDTAPEIKKVVVLSPRWGRD